MLLLAAVSGRGEGWGTFAFLMLFTTVQVILAGGAIATYRLVGYAKGDWRFLARGVVDPLVYFGLIAVLVLGSSPYLDATGTIRATTEDRPATPQDPGVQ